MDKILRKIKQELFLNENGSNYDTLLKLCKTALFSLVKNQGEGSFFPKRISKERMGAISSAEVPLKFNGDIIGLLEKLNEDLDGAVNINSSLTAKNIVPQANFFYLASHMATSLYMLNGVTADNSANALDAELKCTNAFAKLADFDENNASGVFTFSGTGTSLYGIKMGISKASPNSINDGVNDKMVVLGPLSSHYSQQNVMNWLGLGKDNYIQVKTNLDQTINIENLEKTAKKELEKGKKIACILLSGGTTSNMAIDDIKAVYELRNDLISEFNLSYVPHIHVDSVIGWVYLNFKNYDFDKNELAFSKDSVPILKENTEKISNIKYADSFAIDFHKTGFIPYCSSMILAKDKNDLERLSIDFVDTSPIFHDGGIYHPGKFTLETSRSAATIVSTWKTIQMFGQEGYQVLMANSIDNTIYFREQFKKHFESGLYIINKRFYGCDIFIRCYPKGSNQEKIFSEEQNSKELVDFYNSYTNNFFTWFVKNYKPSKEMFAIGKTNSACYTKEGFPMSALRFYLLNPSISKKSIDYIISEILEAKKQFDIISLIEYRQQSAK